MKTRHKGPQAQGRALLVERFCDSLARVVASVREKFPDADPDRLKIVLKEELAGLLFEKPEPGESEEAFDRRMQERLVSRVRNRVMS